MTHRVGVVGFGLIGRARVDALRKLRDHDVDIDIVGILDPNVERLPDDLARVASTEELLERNPDFVIVSAPHDVAIDVAERLLRGDTDVLIEKPLGRSLDEAKRVAAAATESGRTVHVGMNYRFFEGVRRLLLDVREGWFGNLISARILLGHGGAPEDRDSWKLDATRAGGGCLLDPGIHALDLVLQLTPEPTVLLANAWAGFWKTGIEEACHVALTSRDIPLISLDLSIVRWRSRFEFEVIGTDGYGVVDGRDRSYGVQRYRRGRRWAWRNGLSQSDSEEEVVVSDGSECFRDELFGLLGDPSSRGWNCTLAQGLQAMDLLESARSLAAVGRR